jgi:hypothetical protein
VDGVVFAPMTLYQPRADVCGVYALQSCPNVGWSYILDTGQLPDGPHTLTFMNPFETSSNIAVSVPVTIANFAASQSNPMRVAIDHPGSQAGNLSGTVAIDGWAIADDSAIDSVLVSVDGVNANVATYGGSRLDVCVVFPNRLGCPNVGWNFALDTTRLADGPHQLAVTAHSAGGKYGTVQSSFTVSNAGLNNSLHAAIDYPKPNSVVSGTRVLTGWALNDNGPVGFVTISVDGVLNGMVGDSLFRPDVCAVYPGRANCPLAGWTYGINSLLLTDGQHTLDVTLSDGAQHATFSTSFRSDNSFAANSTLLYVDQPNAGSATLSGVATVSGWAVDDLMSLNGRVSISVDGVLFDGPITYYLARPDVCAAYPDRGGCAGAGWSYQLDTTALSDGSHILTVTVRGTKTQTTSVKINVANGNSAPASVKVYIDQPTANSPSLRGVAVVSGWAFATTGYLPPVSIYIDNVFAVPTVANQRPDVCAAFPAALGCPYVGWSVELDTTQFMDGTHTLTVVGRNVLFGTGIASVPITIGNFSAPDPMHLAIDASAGGTLSGTANLFGWAASDEAAIGTIAVAVDGAGLANPSYGDSRSDVCAVYQNRLGCPNVGWHVALDTTKLSNGAHTVSVTATDGFGAQATQTATVRLKN